MKIKKYSTDKNGATFSKKTLSYVAMTGAFLAVAGQSNGQVVYTNVNPDDTVRAPGANMYDYFPIDFDNDGVVDVVVHHHIEGDGVVQQARIGTFSATSSSAPIPLANRENRIPASIYTTASNHVYLYPSVLNQGDIISAGSGNMHSFLEGDPIDFQMTLNYRIGANQWGQWNGATGFMGMEFISGSSLFYGWVELDVDSAASRIIVKGYAYESTPGMLIHAGDVGVGINEGNSVDGSYFMLSSNPVSAALLSAAIFSSDKVQDYKVEIINNLGEVLDTRSAKAVAGGNTVRLHVDNIAAGNYFIKLTLGDSVKYRRLMVAEK
jgi:hypothetical protein